MVITADRPEFAGSADLLTRARAGETLAFCRLAAQDEGRLLQQACGLTRDPSAAEDLVSETLVEAWRSLSRFNGACRFSTWLFSILLHRHQKALRRARSRPISIAALPSAEANQRRQAQENLPAACPSPAEEVMRKEEQSGCDRQSRPCRRSISRSFCCGSLRMLRCPRSPLYSAALSAQ